MLKRYIGFIEPDSPEAGLINKIDFKKLPVHVGIIMDGNGRWAKKRGEERNAGHKRGAESARHAVEISARTGIRILTLYTFSQENWKRPKREVNALMNMLYDNLLDQSELLTRNEIKLKILGDMGKLPGKLQKKLIEVQEMSKNFKKMQVNLALNYGGRQEIIRAVRKIVTENISASAVNEKMFSGYLYTEGQADPDLIIRTSGELRLSNFLIYQAAYAELIFSETLWPDFGSKDFFEAIIEFQNRKRRFGGI